MARETSYQQPADHPAEHTHGSGVGSGGGAGGESSYVPLAEPLPFESPVDLTPAPEGPLPPLPPFPVPLPEPELPWPIPEPFPWPRPRPCLINLRSGCYRITFTPNTGFVVYHGTMRVDRAEGRTIVSGDLYRFLVLRPLPELVPAEIAIGAVRFPRPLPPIFPRPLNIPIYARNRYYSYLKVTGIRRPPIFSHGPCQLTLTAEEYVYTQPPAGSFNGTFPAPPGTRTVTIVLEQKPAPPGYASSYFEGTLYEGGVAKGTFTMGWVSTSFRRATLEIDTLTGSVAPAPVPAHPSSAAAAAGLANEDFRTVFETAGWNLGVVQDQVNVPVPAGVNANACWSSANLHALMVSVRNPATNLDTEWRMHLVVVPATLGCGRGVMYDTIGVPREGVASFSNDGYPSSQSANFGTAANQMQVNVPRAFLRSASHEVGHGFNQIHQEQEAGADNSIMTTTPSVADVLGGPATGAPGVFPTDIALAFNQHVRHHLVHFPDIVVRPGGMTFGSGHSSVVPEADRHFFPPDELELTLSPDQTRVELGEPLRLAWALTNRSGAPIPVPADIGIEAQHAFITVTTPGGMARPMPSFVISTEDVSIVPLDPGASLEAQTRVFWSSRGFAFESPGKHTVEVRLVWTHAGVACGARASVDIWVNYPSSATDNDAASLLMDQQVGMYVALGGGAYHLTDAVSRLEQAMTLPGVGDEPGARVLRGYDGLLPSGRGSARDEGKDARRRGDTPRR